MPAQSDVGRLYAEILADPASEAARLVYADHLIDLGDPRGELVQAQIKFEKIEWDDPARRAIDERIADLLAMHESTWTRDVRALGFDDHLQQVSLRRGFVERVSTTTTGLAALVPQLRAITPLRELNVTVKDDRDLGALGLACALEGLAVRVHDPRKHLAAIAKQLPHWPHEGKLQMLQLDGAAAAHAIASTPALASLRRLRIGGIGAAGMAALAQAAHLANVHTLELPQSQLGPSGLEHLARGKLAGVKRLQLEQARLTAPDVATLARFGAQLVQLRLHHNKLGDAGARHLAAQFPALELLDIEMTELRGEGLTALLASKLPKLASLDISRNPVSLASFADIELPALRHLACLQNGVDARIAGELARANLDELRSLDLTDNASLLDDGVIALAGTERLPKLDVLRLKSTGVGERGLAVLGASALGKRLRAIDIAKNHVTDAELRALLGGSLAALDALDLGGSRLTSQGVQALVASPVAAQLKHLTVTGLADGALASLLAGELPELRSLVADRFDDEAAHVLANARGVPALHTFVLSARGLTDTGAITLAESTQLQRVLWFELDAPAVTEVGRAALRRRFGHHVAVFAGGSLHAFSSLGRRV